MINFFKNFGKGILYVLVLPLIIVALAIYGVVALFIFIYLAIKGLVLFFTGRSLYEDLPEDKEAKKRLGIKTEQEDKPLSQQAPKDVEQYIEPNNDGINTDPFYVPEYLRPQEEVEEEPHSFEEEPPVEHKASIQNESEIEPEPEREETIFPSFLDEEKEPEIEEKEEPQILEEEVISLEKTNQNATILDINELDEADDNDSDDGINIDFN
jgi:hypothetical protein